MREIGISPRFSRDKFVPLQTKQRYSTRDISGEVFLTLFFRGFVPFLSLADFVSRDKNLQVLDLQRLKSCFEELVTATTSNHQNGLPVDGLSTLPPCPPDCHPGGQTAYLREPVHQNGLPVDKQLIFGALSTKTASRWTYSYADEAASSCPNTCS